MTQSELIIGKFGGVRPMASRLEIPSSTVQRWKNGGYIPARRQEEVLTKAKELGIDLQPSDFFNLTPAPIERQDSSITQQNHVKTGE